MRSIWKFFVITFVLVAMAVPVMVLAQEPAPEWWVYQPDSEKCVMARVRRNEYQERELALPGYLQRILAKCEKYKNVAVQKERTSKEKRKGMLLGLFE